MKAAAFDYVRAGTVAEAVAALHGAGGFARIMAGGQSLGPMLNLRLARPDCVIDVRRCRELRSFTDEGESAVYGAAVTHAEFEDGAVPDVAGGLLRRAASGIAYRAVRNRGTLGGSIAHADPAADWLSIMLALGAQVLVEGPSGRRAVQLRDFATGPFQTTLAEHEVVFGVRVPKWSPGLKLGYQKFTAKVGEFASALAVVLDDPDGGESRIVVGAIERSPLVLDGDDARELMALSKAGPKAVLERLGAGLDGMSRATRHLHAVNLLRAMHDASDGVKR